MKIKLDNCKTSAQAVTKICYNEATRNLNFRIKCKDLKDLKECVRIIERYNAFDYKKVNKALDYYLTDKESDKDIFTFEIAREGSVALYVYSYYFTNKIEQQKFESKLRTFAKETMADECHFNFPTNDNKEKKSDPIRLECRLWWD